MLLLHPWDSKEYQSWYGMEKDEVASDESINAMLEILEKGVKGNFVGVVENFNNESNIGVPVPFHIVRCRTVMGRFLEFKRIGRRFVVPSISKKDKDRPPAIFSVYPNFKEACIKFIDNNIGD
eukprot:15361554-Ditylum_brightwellii.AAC.1